MEKFQLRLYITGRTPRSERAIQNLQHICDDCLREQCEISIVDILERPELAEEARILATPTLVKQSPPPVLKVIGDLSDFDKVLVGLGIQALTSTTGKP
jgi:circadian clock protein KaiB